MKPIYLYALFFLLMSCNKFLDKKSDQSLNEPSRIQDLQSLMDATTYYYQNDYDLSYSINGADEIHVDSANYIALGTEYGSRYQAMYQWGKNDLYDIPSNFSSAWGILYQQVYKSNLIMDEIENISGSSQQDIDNVKGQTYFYRGKAYLRLMNLHCKAYDKSTEETDLGLPLNLSSNFNITYKRNTMRETVLQIQSDLKMAAALLPNKTIHILRPNKNAAYAYLSRFYLSIGDYDSCYKFANLSLESYNHLIDYNQPEEGFDPNATSPFSPFNKEEIHSSQGPPDAVAYYAYPNPELYAAYDVHDLRRTMFFTDSITPVGYFKGSYEGNNTFFTGVAVDEIYLNRAESLVRMGKVQDGLEDLNTLLSKRFERGFYNSITGLNSKDALEKVLEERKKELIFRGLRWSDIKRLNVLGENIVQTRIIASKRVSLSPGNTIYAYPIPMDVVNQYKISQNP